MICLCCNKEYDYLDSVDYACIIVFGKCRECLENEKSERE